MQRKGEISMSKRAMLVLGTLAVLALAAIKPANADSPSFGRIVYGMTGGTVVLPKDAWQTIDISFNGLAYTQNKFGSNPAYLSYAGDTQGFTNYAAAAAANSIVGNNGNTNEAGAGIVTSGNGGGAFTGPLTNTFVFAAKLGFRAGLGPWATTHVYTADTSASTTPPVLSADTGAGPYPDTSTVLFSADDEAGAFASKTVKNPFSFADTSTANPFGRSWKFYSQDKLNATVDPGTPKHIKIYSANFLGTATYFLGFEDTIKGDYDYNDSVIMATFTAVPEPMFFQLGALLAIGGTCLWRMRRSNKSALQAAQLA